MTTQKTPKERIDEIKTRIYGMRNMTPVVCALATLIAKYEAEIREANGCVESVIQHYQREQDHQGTGYNPSSTSGSLSSIRNADVHAGRADAYYEAILAIAPALD